MKKLLLIILMFMSRALQADPQQLIAHVQKLADQSPDRETFVNLITAPSEEGKSIFEFSQQVSPRLYATLLQAQTSLIISDDDLDRKLQDLALEQELLAALEDQNIYRVARAIMTGADVNTELPSGHTSLMLAVLKADQELLEELLKRGARVTPTADFRLDHNDASPQKLNALELAQKLNYKSIAKILKKSFS